MINEIVLNMFRNIAGIKLWACNLFFLLQSFLQPSEDRRKCTVMIHRYTKYYEHGRDAAMPLSLSTKIDSFTTDQGCHQPDDSVSHKKTRKEDVLDNNPRGRSPLEDGDLDGGSGKKPRTYERHP